MSDLRYLHEADVRYRRQSDDELTLDGIVETFPGWLDADTRGLEWAKELPNGCAILFCPCHREAQ